MPEIDVTPFVTVLSPSQRTGQGSVLAWRPSGINTAARFILQQGQLYTQVPPLPTQWLG